MANISKLIDKATHSDAFQNCCQSYAHANGSSRAIAAAALHGAAVPAMVQALRAASQFIINGVEMGYIRMPDADTPDSAHETLPMIAAILACIDGEQA